MKKMGDSRVIKLKTDPERFEFLVQLVNNIGNANGLSDYTTNGTIGLTPSTFYYKLCHNDLTIPTFYMASLKDGKLTNIEHVTPRGLSDMVTGRDWSDMID